MQYSRNSSSPRDRAQPLGDCPQQRPDPWANLYRYSLCLCLNVERLKPFIIDLRGICKGPVCMKRLHRAFTLVELFVVIAIIGVLVSRLGFVCYGVAQRGAVAASRFNGKGGKRGKRRHAGECGFCRNSLFFWGFPYKRSERGRIRSVCRCSPNAILQGNHDLERRSWQEARWSESPA